MKNIENKLYRDFWSAGYRIFGLYGGDKNGNCGCGNNACKAPFKHPLVSNWPHTPGWEEEQIETMEISDQFKTGYGVLCHGLLVIDVDARNGGVPSFERLKNDFQAVEKAGLIVNTGSGRGSKHLYFKVPQDLALVTHHPDYPGIDFRNGPSFVVGPGSMHASGNRYEVAYGSPYDIDAAPQALIDLLQKPERHRADLANGTSMDVSHADLADMLKHVDPDTDHETWIRCGMAVHYASGGTGFDVWDAWSNKGAKYPGRDNIAKRWHSFGKSANPVTVGTLIRYAEAGGWKQSVTFNADEEFIDKDHQISSLTNSRLSTKESWRDMLPFVEKLESKTYPIEALPEPIRLAVLEVQGFVQAPMALVASTALGSLSLACQASIDVQRAEGLVGPSSLFLLAIADSGERKSSCEGHFTKGLKQAEAEAQERAKPLLKKHEADLELWEIKKRALKEKISELAKKGQPAKYEEKAFSDHIAGRPEKPKVLRLFFTDTTPEALAFALSKDWPSIGLMSSEAGLVFGGHGMGKDVVTRNLALYNVLWDGGSIAIDRRTSESFQVDGARLTVSLQVQPATIVEFLRRTGDLARGTGFLARFLLVWPASTQGHRPFRDPPSLWPHVNSFNDRLFEIVSKDIELDDRGRLHPRKLTLLPEAKLMWIKFHDDVERELTIGGQYADLRDVASKIADNAARLAGLFHVFLGKTGAIDVASFSAARSIAEWHLHEARRFLGEMAMPAELSDAARLERWMISLCKREGVGILRLNEVRQKGPIRVTKLLYQAITELQQLGRIREVIIGRAKALEINPVLLQS